ncbi:hypothetical protein [Pedobacter sp. BMA]|nr:hypothetical protein [Pedobacter sp. BMA]
MAVFAVYTIAFVAACRIGVAFNGNDLRATLPFYNTAVAIRFRLAK